MAMKYSIVVCIIVILLYLHVCFVHSISTICRHASNKPRKLIIDTDAGGDDALAIMLAVSYELKTCDIEILAITCTYGNTYLENVTQNVLKILTVANRSDIPVYIGSVRPLINPYQFDDYFGKDGFGDFNFTQPITAKVNKTKPAAVLLVELAKKYQGEITIVTIGPLTNVAVAIALEPNFLNLIKKLVIMGSSIQPEMKTPKIEFNFGQDPESDWIVLNNTNKVHTIFPIDTVLDHAISKKERRKIYNNVNYPIARFLSLAERLALKKSESWEPSDGMTMTIAIKPEIITKSFKTRLVPILVGDERGAVMIDSNNTIYNANVIQDFDVVAFKNFIIEYLS